MIEQKISFALPKPWNNETFSVERIGAINFLVGPNGSGKSRFADVLKGYLPNARMLGTDRLEGMGLNPMRGIVGDHFAGGYQKSHFQNFKNIGTAVGAGIDTFIILEERPDIRIIVESTLSALFNSNNIYEGPFVGFRSNRVWAFVVQRCLRRILFQFCSSNPNATGSH
jgi:energy-coupling factor transporter ATP-binding protein EcfA2